MRVHLRWWAASVPLVAVALGGSASVWAQTQAKAGTSRPWAVPRTPDGRPDFQGMWTNATLTPWTLAFPLTRDDEYRIYEHACHEGNRAIEGVLRGARYQERTPGVKR